MHNEAEIFDQIVERRRSYRAFDPDHQLAEGVVKRSLERTIKSPNSSNMQLWEFYRIKSPEAVKEVARICLNQNGAKTASEIVVFVARPDLWRERVNLHLSLIEKEAAPATVGKRLMSNSAADYYGRLMPLFYNPSFPFIKDIVKRVMIWNKTRTKPFMRDVLHKFIPVVVHKSVGIAAQTFMLSIVAEGYDCVPMEGLDSKLMKQFLKLPKGAGISMAIAVGKGLDEGIRGPRFRLGYKEVVFDL